MTTIKKFSGIIPALITPFKQNGDLDEERLRGVVQDLLHENIGGLYLTGSTGECFLMTDEERNRTIEIVAEEVRGRVPLIAHVGDVGTRKSIELAKQAERLGVDAISSVPPFYWHFTEDELYGYYRDLAGSTSLPFIIYNIQLAGLLQFQLLQKLAKLPNVCGVKYTATTHYEINLLKNKLGQDFQVFSGCDEMGLSGLMFGADGLIGSFYNLMPELYVAICNAVAAKQIDLAAKLQRDADLVIALALQYCYVSVIKIAMGWKGVDGGYCRAPFINSHAHEDELKEKFRILRDENQITGVKFLEQL